MLDPGEAREVAGRFGVALAQVRRDHLVSHLLAALSRSLADRLTLEPQQALETVREAWGDVAGWGEEGSSTSPQ